MTRRVRLITVCDACFRASCWHGEFFCDAAVIAGTVEKTATELRRMNLEHPDHYSKHNVERVCAASTYATEGRAP